MPFPYDAILIVSFGGPEGPDEVLPFLRNVLRGRKVPEERMREVAEHYQQFGGVSPINQQNRELMTALGEQLHRRGPDLPIYWGNRNWHPFLIDTVQRMADDRIRRALAFFPSPYSSYSSCRQYRENIADAQASVGPSAPEIHKLRNYFNHPQFLQATVDRVREAVAQLEAPADELMLLFTAHSIPLSMAAACQYENQLREVCRLVAERLSCHNWRLVYQSRSGPPHQPWLEPDVCDAIEQAARQGDASRLVISPVGFISDHLEVLYDLDVEARQKCEQWGLPMVRAKTVGSHPQFIEMIRQLILEWAEPGCERPSVGAMPPWPVPCPAGCCPPPSRSPSPAAG